MHVNGFTYYLCETTFMGIIRREIYTADQNNLAAIFNHLGHPGRLKIILMLLQSDGLSLSQIQNQLGLSQSATSDQVRILKDAGIISGVHSGTSVIYSLERQELENIKQQGFAFLNEI